ncbi:MAG: hypothetical protein PHI31_07120 [Desulfuromonadaceae bacterium]|nr:hypothetical protein [Desulfuromonadaceae bacterium]
MNRILNNNGIALVTSLMLTLISLTIVMYLLLMVTSGIKQSGANKRYRTALEATFGATDIVIKELLPKIFTETFSNNLTNPSATYPTTLNFMSANSDSCIMDKLTKQPSQWGVGCSNTSDPKVSADFTLKLNSTSLTDSYTVYTKIVDTVCSDKRAYPAGKCTGSDLSGYEQLDGGQGTAAGSSGVSVQAMPATYRIEIVGEKTSNPKEKSHLSILYAY